ncbi:Phenylalanine--tRNA ligase alpha subunit [Frankliniella fusca]|uniref:Phenylalanine--tRNA ligase alpha subunit n=1 Tax=Frankliniella fusca TaxID=407009 RepID=A0AAE1LSD6_9NEOP|nr:Phenylalanine--tRNA ligase alpha subunit [Frankliniella fusca]
MSVLVFWLDDQKTSIVNIQGVPEGEREPGKVANVVWQDGQKYPAQIVKVSKCLKTLETAEKAFISKYNNLTNGEVSSKRQMKSKQNSSDVLASAVQVAKALGERVKLPPQQAAEKSKLARQRRMDSANVRQVECLSDTVAFKSSNVVKRNLIRNGFDLSSEKENTPLSQVGSPTQDEEVQPHLPSSPTTSPTTSPTRTPAKKVNSPASSGTCERCRFLDSHINPASMEFLLSLNKFCNVEPVSSNFNYSAVTQREGVDEVSHLRPLPVQSGHKKVELSVGSGLFLSKSSKAKAVYSSGGDPDKLTREILTVLYGERLKQPGISALGHGKKKLGIGGNDLQNIFMEKKTRKENEVIFNFNAFIRVVNKKLKSASRDRGVPPSKTSSGEEPESPLALAIAQPALVMGPQPQPHPHLQPYSQPYPHAYSHPYSQQYSQSYQHYDQPGCSYTTPLMDTHTILEL